MPDRADRMPRGWHRFPVRVYWEDTDAGGIVYYANYLKFAERARTELLRSAGIDQSRLMDAEGLAFAVRRCQVDFRSPARLDDLLDVTTRVTDVGGASIAMEQVIFHVERDVVRLALDIACVDRNGRPARLPPAIRHGMAELVESGFTRNA